MVAAAWVLCVPTYEVARRREGGGHDPRRPERDDLGLVAGPRVPDDELAVQRAADRVPAANRKMLHAQGQLNVFRNDKTTVQCADHEVHRYKSRL